MPSQEQYVFANYVIEGVQSDFYKVSDLNARLPIESRSGTTGALNIPHAAGDKYYWRNLHSYAQQKRDASGGAKQQAFNQAPLERPLTFRSYAVV